MVWAIGPPIGLEAKEGRFAVVFKPTTAGTSGIVRPELIRYLEINGTKIPVVFRPKHSSSNSKRYPGTMLSFRVPPHTPDLHGTAPCLCYEPWLIDLNRIELTTLDFELEGGKMYHLLDMRKQSEA